MKKSILVAMSVASVLVVTLAGCGDDAGNANQVVEPGQAQAPSAPNAPGGSGPSPSGTTEAQLGD